MLLKWVRAYVDELEVQKELDTSLVFSVIYTDWHTIKVVGSNGDFWSKNACRKNLKVRLRITGIGRNLSLYLHEIASAVTCLFVNGMLLRVIPRSWA